MSHASAKQEDKYIEIGFQRYSGKVSEGEEYWEFET